MMSDAPRAPSAYVLERVVSAWMQERARLAADEELAADENPVTAAMAFEPNEVHPDDLIRQLVTAIVWTDARHAQIKAMEDDLKDRRQRYARRVEDMRATLFQLMVALDYDSFSDRCMRKVLITKGPAPAVITDLKKLPAEYVRVVTEPDKRALLTDLREGVVIPGAELGNAAPVLQLRPL